MLKKISVRQHLMTGVSYMIPFVVSGGVILALSVLFSGSAAVPSDPLLKQFFDIGVAGLSLMVPVLAGYISFSIADRPGIAPGMIGGFLANSVGAGFLGGIIAGLLAGLVVYYLKKMPVHKSIASVKPIIIIPLLGTLIVASIMVFVIGSPIAGFMATLTEGLKNLGTANRFVLGAVIGVMIAIDMGGPINKVAYGLGVALIATIDPATGLPITAGLQFMAAVSVAICTPPLGMALATFLVPKKFNPEEREAGKAAVVMGAIGITEGAIPFAANDPIRVIPSICIGSAVAGMTAMLFNVLNPAPWGGWIVIPTATNKIGYFVATIIGSVVTALLIMVLKKDIIETESDKDKIIPVNNTPTKSISKDNVLNIVAVTACPSGVAHTYMSAKALIKAAEKLGHNIRVETQGSIGIETPLTTDEVANADLVILTSDIGIKGEDRFVGKNVHYVKVKDAVKKASEILNDIIK